MNPVPFTKQDFDFELPEYLIARYPLENRSDSRLLVANPKNDNLKHEDSHFKNLANFLEPGDLLVLNNSRVIPARIYGHKPTGGKVEILIERILNEYQALTHIGSNKAIKIGQSIFLTDGSIAHVVEKHDRLFTVEFAKDLSVLKRLEVIGHMPLPPYLKRDDEVSDLTRYQTVYAKLDGSVAAPTAGLHFDKNVFNNLRNKDIHWTTITLHVGAGTFMPVQVDDISNHQMHHEWMEISQETCNLILDTKKRGGRIVAVGTTSLRALETASRDGYIKPFCGDTNLFILPGFEFKTVDALITNFHLPESTLLMLVAAFIGIDFMHKIYQHAIANHYRFYSYGDASLLFRNNTAN